jgi:hypothetical protein
VNFDALYTILASVARDHGLLTYTELSQCYHTATGDWHEPHGSWDVPLGQLNLMLHGFSWPPLSAVVVLQADGGGHGEPGGGFWQSSPNIPARPANALARTTTWGQLLNDVYAAAWPGAIPTAPPV